MPPTPVTDPELIYRCVLAWTIGDPGADARVTSGFWIRDANGVPDAPSAVLANLDTIVTALWGATTSDPIRDYFSNGATLTEIVLEQPLVDPQPVGLIAAIGGGGGETTALPIQNAVIVSMLTDTRGAAYRGRMFLPGLGSVANGDGVVTPSVSAGILAAFNTLATALGVDGYAPIVVSRFVSENGVVIPRDPPVYTGVESYRVSGFFGAQRRRRS